MRTSLAASLLGLLLLCSTSWADVRLPRLFADNMVLQQQTSNAVWGWADADERVTVTASWGATAATKADKNGRWKLFLATPRHGTNHSLVITGENTIRIQNVAIGEVWLCAGQSNMGWAMGNTFGAEQETAVDLPNFRIFKSQREHWHEPLEESRDRLQQWKLLQSQVSRRNVCRLLLFWQATSPTPGCSCRHHCAGLCRNTD